MAGKRGRPRKSPEPATNAAAVKAVEQVNAALGSLAFARDFALTIEAGGESPHHFEELAGEVRKAICEAGAQIEEGLCALGLLPAKEKSGWFVPELKRAVA